MAENSLASDDTVTPGRPVVLVPTRPGFWQVVLGAVIALLAPLFGILIGSGIGQRDSFASIQPMYWGFFIGGLVGVVALLVVAAGARRLWRGAHPTGDEEEDDR